jgi:6-phosphogluconolactonase (cycloisomerase 2 family)
VLLIGCYTPPRGEGAGVVRALPDGRTSLVAPADSPSFLARHPTLPLVYATDAQSCHIAVCGDHLVTTQYGAGTVTVHRLRADGTIGPGTDRRDGFVHPHMAYADGDGVLVADLGRDAVDRFRFDTAGRLVPQASYAVPGGPRHFLRSGSRWYAVCERSGTLAVLSSGWRLLSVHSGLTTPSEIAAFEDRFLYVANRGPDTVSVFSLTGGPPRLVASVASGGQWPRHLALDSDLLHVAHQHSHDVATLRIDPATGVPSYVHSVKAPSASCVLPLPGARRLSRIRILAPSPPSA